MNTLLTIAQTEGTLLAVAGTLIIILLGIVGYFIAQRYAAAATKERQLTDAIDALRQVVEQLGRAVAKIESGIIAHDEICKLRHAVIDEKFKNMNNE